jgi:hypothetical protein
MFVSDLRHFLDLSDDAPRPARKMAEQLGNVVRAATAAEAGTAWVSGCRAADGWGDDPALVASSSSGLTCRPGSTGAVPAAATRA